MTMVRMGCLRPVQLTRRIGTEWDCQPAGHGAGWRGWPFNGNKALFNMSIPAPLPVIAVRDLLPGLGFTEDWRWANRLPDFEFHRNNLELRASEVMNRHFQSCILFSGLWRDARTLKMIDFEIPLMVESAEQAVAWIAYGVGTDYEPPGKIDWFEDGKAWQDSLPWERYYADLRLRAAERDRMRALRPHCRVARSWLRLLLNQMSATIDGSQPASEFLVHFDGRMLLVQLPNETIGAPATGPAPWTCRYRLTVTPLLSLPKRLTTDPVEVGLWEGLFEIERSRYLVAEA